MQTFIYFALLALANANNYNLQSCQSEATCACTLDATAKTVTPCADLTAKGFKKLVGPLPSGFDILDLTKSGPLDASAFQGLKLKGVRFGTDQLPASPGWVMWSAELDYVDMLIGQKNVPSGTLVKSVKPLTKDMKCENFESFEEVSDCFTLVLRGDENSAEISKEAFSTEVSGNNVKGGEWQAIGILGPLKLGEGAFKNLPSVKHLEYSPQMESGRLPQAHKTDIRMGLNLLEDLTVKTDQGGPWFEPDILSNKPNLKSLTTEGFGHYQNLGSSMGASAGNLKSLTTTLSSTRTPLSQVFKGLDGLETLEILPDPKTPLAPEKLQEALNELAQNGNFPKLSDVSTPEGTKFDCSANCPALTSMPDDKPKEPVKPDPVPEPQPEPKPEPGPGTEVNPTVPESKPDKPEPTEKPDDKMVKPTTKKPMKKKDPGNGASYVSKISSLLSLLVGFSLCL